MQTEIYRPSERPVTRDMVTAGKGGGFPHRGELADVENGTLFYAGTRECTGRVQTGYRRDKEEGTRLLLNLAIGE